jgi:hypothetical protein
MRQPFAARALIQDCRRVSEPTRVVARNVDQVLDTANDNGLGKPRAKM